MRGVVAALAAVVLSVSAPLLSGPAAAQTCTCAGSGQAATILSDEAPPPLPEYDQPPIPGSGYVWTPGYWAWNNYEYYWVPGTWIEPPQSGLLWTPGYWAFNDGVYAFHRGYWGPRVGYYGEVDYGFGYGGHGYEGGYWNGGKFFYNRTVNNFGLAHIENVYERPPVPPSSERASFDGPGGTTGRPTPQEEEFERERHVPPTRVQIDHARTASMTSGLFISANHGKPAVAATVRPTIFTGPGTVGAREGGVRPPILRANQPPGGEPNPRGSPSIPEPQLPPPVEGPAHGLPPGIQQQRQEAPRPVGIAPNPEPQRQPRGAAPQPGLPAGIERQRQEAPRPVGIAPNPEPQRQPGGAAPQPGLPAGIERQRQDAPRPVGNAPNPEPHPQPGAGAPPPRVPPGIQRQQEGAQFQRPAPGAGGQIVRPPQQQHAPGAPPLCGEPGQPRCP